MRTNSTKGELYKVWLVESEKTDILSRKRFTFCHE
jgi:hypothetical protein